MKTRASFRYSVKKFFLLIFFTLLPLQSVVALDMDGMLVTKGVSFGGNNQPTPSLDQVLSYPPDPTADIPWSSGTSTVAHIQAAFNNARTVENNQLGTSIPMMTLPSQTEWNNMSDGEKALWLINRERIDRGVMPLQGLEANVSGVAQYYADYLLDNNTWGHNADGRSPWQRLSDNAAIGACQDFLSVAENIFVFVTSGSSIPLPLERAIYGWMYEDGPCCGWGHRHAILWYPYNDNSGAPGSEGFLGIGRANGGPYQGPFSQPWPFAEMIVMNVFDPCASWNDSPPVVNSIMRADSNPTSASSVNYNVSFSESVTGVGVNDFTLTIDGGISGAAVSNVTGSGSTRLVTVNTGSGTGTLLLNVADNDSILDASGNPLGGGGPGNGDYISGEVYNIVAPNINVFIAGSLIDDHYVPSPGGLRVSYNGVDDGPLQVENINSVPVIAALRHAISQNGVVQSWSQLMGLPDTQLSDTYYFPAYNNVTLSDQLRFANLGNAQTTVTVKIGSVVNQSYVLQAGESLRVSYPGVDAGPVTVSSNSQLIIAALRNAWSQNGIVESWVQLMGLPDTQLATTYYFPAYNNVTLSDQLRFANLGNAQTTVTVKIGSVVNQSYVLQAGESLRVSYPGVDSGPVTVSSNSQPIIAALRNAWSQNGIVESWSQMMGLPASQLSTAYYFPAYNNVTLSDQLRFANLGNAQTTVTVKIGSVVNQSYVLQAGESLRVSYPGVDSGPVTVSSNSQLIIAALRNAWSQNGIIESWVQLMGLPAAHLSDIYYFPAYNNVTLSDQLRIAIP